MSLYPYAMGDRLNDRNSYFYSAYFGQPFFVAWRQSRKEALTTLPAPAEPIANATDTPDCGHGFDTAQLIARLLGAQPLGAEHRQLAGKLLQRFEVSKRLHQRYDDRFKPVLDSRYDDYSLYTGFAAVCLRFADETTSLPFLNGLLKCLDTLIAERDRLPPKQQAELAWLLPREAAWVAQIAAEAGVELAVEPL